MKFGNFAFVIVVMLAVLLPATTFAEQNNPNTQQVERTGVVDTITGGVNKVVGGVTGGVNKVVGGITGGISDALGGLFGFGGGAPAGTTATYSRVRDINELCNLNGAFGSGNIPNVNSVIGSALQRDGVVSDFVKDTTNNVTGAVTGAVNGTLNSVTGGLIGGSGGAFGAGSSGDIKFISKSVKCFEGLFTGIVEEKLTGMVDFMRDAVFAALALYVIFYGIKVSTGMITEQKAKGEFVIHALKLAFVSWLIFNYGVLEMWALTQQIYDGLLQLVLIPPQMTSCTYSADNLDSLWGSMDCILSNFVGWGAQNGYGTKSEIPLVFGMFTSALNSGSGGAFIALIVFLSILSIVMAMLQVAFIYLLSMMGLILAFMLSPITIPMMLFAATKNIFDGWWKLIISLILQPVVMFAFLSFMMGMFTEIIDGPQGLKAIYAQAKPFFGTSEVGQQGQKTFVDIVFQMFNHNSGGAIAPEASLIFSLISVLIIGYLVSAFSKVVGEMAKELSGNPLSPNLAGNTPGFLKGGF